MNWIFIYFLLINIMGIFFVIVDKHKARKKKWRIRERTFFIISILGGSIGIYSSMRIIHHKTLHKRFMIGIPLVFTVQILLIVFLKYKSII